MSDSEFKTRDASSYDNVTGSFDRFTQSYTTPLAERMIELAGLRAGDRVLDVGTGTAVVALLAAERAGPGCVMGVDLSEAMLEKARIKAKTIGIGLELRKMDAESLDLDEESHDRVLSLFALTHFPNPEKALSEMYRILRPGGTLTLAVGSGPPATSLSGWVRRVGKARDLLLARLGRCCVATGSLEQWMDTRLASSSQEESDWASHHGNRASILPDLVRSAGFVSVRTSWMGRTARFETPEEFWELQATNSSKVRKRLGDVDPETVDGFKREYVSHCRKVVERGGKLVYPYAALFVTASRP